MYPHRCPKINRNEKVSTINKNLVECMYKKKENYPINSRVKVLLWKNAGGGCWKKGEGLGRVKWRKLTKFNFKRLNALYLRSFCLLTKRCRRGILKLVFGLFGQWGLIFFMIKKCKTFRSAFLFFFFSKKVWKALIFWGCYFLLEFMLQNSLKNR